MMRDAGSSPKSPTHPVAWTDVLSIAWFAAMCSGLLYAGMMLFRQQVLGEIALISRDILWMAPLAQLVVFLPVALAILLCVVVPFWNRPSVRFKAVALACAVFVFLTVLTLLIPYNAIADWAKAILALGIAAEATNLFRAAVRRSPPQLARRAVFATLAVVVVAGGTAIARKVGRQIALARLTAPAVGAPNVLMLILDTVRHDSMSLYGFAEPTTPNLLRLAGESTTFDRAMSTAPWSLPSHGTLMTGRMPNELTFDWTHALRGGEPTLASALAARGYVTGGFVANLLYASYETGVERGFLDYEDYGRSARMIMLHSPIAQNLMVQRLLGSKSIWEARHALMELRLDASAFPTDDKPTSRTITDRFLAWEKKAGARPYFAMLNYFDAHGPQYPSADSLRKRFAAQGTDADENLYEASIATLDEEVDRLLQALKREGRLDNTIVVVTSDHGELFGEHGLRGHATSLYREVLHVPLLIRYPAAVPRGQRVSSIVSLRDVPATILYLAKAHGAPLPGTSLAALWRSPAPEPAHPIVAVVTKGLRVKSTLPNAKTGLETVMDDDFQYIRNGFGAEELFRYSSDADEEDDLAHDAASLDVLRRLRCTLDSAVAARPTTSIHQN